MPQFGRQWYQNVHHENILFFGYQPPYKGGADKAFSPHIPTIFYFELHFSVNPSAGAVIFPVRGAARGTYRRRLTISHYMQRKKLIGGHQSNRRPFIEPCFLYVIYATGDLRMIRTGNMKPKKYATSVQCNRQTFFSPIKK
jgi:hypothetical protein